MTNWSIDQTRILTRIEIAAVLADLKRRGRRAVNSRQNLVIFRLATCCGLRVSEIVGIRLRDAHLGVARPYIHIRKAIAKGKKPRRVPLWWDGGTLVDIEAWKAERKEQEAKPGDFLICSQADGSFGAQLDRRNARMRFIAACRALGPDRTQDLTIHDGRHSFVSHSLRAGRSLAEVRDAAGHANVSTTSLYTHVAVEDDGEIGDIFGLDPVGRQCMSF